MRVGRAGAWAIVCVSAGSVACGEDGGGGAERPDAGRAVATYRDTHYTAAGVVEHPREQTPPPQVTVLKPDGQWVNGPAGYSIPGASEYLMKPLPGGEWYYRDGLDLVQSDLTEVDLGRNRVGRPDADSFHPTLTMQVDGSGLAPWASGDGLWLVSPNARAWSFENGDSGLPEVGGTSLDMVRVRWFGPLVQAEQGDELWVIQRRFGGSTVNFMSALHVADLQQSPASAGFIGGGFELLPPRSFNAQTAGWLDLAVSSHTDLQPQQIDVALTIGPFGAVGAFDETGFQDHLGAAAFAADGTLLMSYGDPFPEAWPRFATIEAFASADVLLPGDASAANRRVRMSSLMTLEALLAPGAREPQLGPPRGLVIEGLAADQGALTGVPVTPRLGWSPPAFGAAAGYIVSVYVLESFEGTSFDRELLRITTTKTSVSIPPGYLGPGLSHYFIVTAVAGPGLDLAAHPFRRGAPVHTADAISSTFIVQ